MWLLMEHKNEYTPKISMFTVCTQSGKCTSVIKQQDP